MALGSIVWGSLMWFVFREFLVDMKSFYSDEVWALFLNLNDFHDFFRGAK